MDLQNEAIELQKIFHQDYKTYLEETEAIKAHLEARYAVLRIRGVVGRSEQLDCIDCDYVRISDNTIECRKCGSIIEFAN